MSPESRAVALWFAKFFQMISAIILTPEIIGPDRLQRLERYIGSQDFSKRESTVWFVLVIAGLIITVPWIILDASYVEANVRKESWTLPVKCCPVYLIFILIPFHDDFDITG